MDSATPVVAAAAGKLLRVDNRSRVGRGVPEITEIYNKKCSCRREKTIVFCRACGYYCHGRVRLKCPKHPRVTFLLDITECPRCHSSICLDEYCGDL
ncbi:jg14765 [Pararge aegeria aegeria]|uniref:Jg14765 protein n=2 Tax=Pararge aegeria TaxID=116150 RepID=A0A8S4SLY9_9NEOP|nr:jg14765 [Pararge aegeria aegeria]